jgi:hypothetical protein
MKNNAQLLKQLQELTKGLNKVKPKKQLTSKQLEALSNGRNKLSIFWFNVMRKLDLNTTVGVLLKVEFNDGSIKTLSYLQKVNKTDFNDLSDILCDYVNLRSEDYNSKIIIKVVFQYIILGEAIKTEIVKSKQMNNLIPTFSFSGFNLPLTTDLTKWGEIISNKNGKVLIMFNEETEIVIDVKISSNKQTYKFMIEDKILLTIVDTYGNNSTSFTRTVNDKKLIIENGIIVFKSQLKKVGGIKPTKPSKDLKNKFITLDIETRTLDGILSPYCISFFDGTKATSFYLSNYKSSDLMLIAAIKSLMKRKYNGWKVYVHNGSSFDYIFLLRIITQLGKVNPLIKDGKFINLELCWGKVNEENGKYQ